MTYTGAYNTTMSYTAFTYGVSSLAIQVGQKVTWSDTHTFPASGVSTINLDVASSMFFLKIQDLNASNSVQGIYVNYGTVAQTLDNINVPNDGNVYNIGYYNAYTNTELYILANHTGVYWSYFPALSFVQNQSFTFILN